MCQWPRKTCGAEVYYLQELLTCHFNLSYLYNHWANFYQTHILCPPYMQPYIPNLKKIGPVVHEICVLEDCPIFFTFSSSHHFTKVILSHPSHGSISFKFGTPTRHFVDYLSLNFGDV